MSVNVIVWDIETVPDLRGFAAANGLEGKSDDEVRVELGDKFRSSSIIPSFVSGLWLPIGNKTIGQSMRSVPHTVVSVLSNN